jgi:hypothetical protein
MMQAIRGDREFGKWLNLGLSSSADIDIVTFNNDTPYSYAWSPRRPGRPRCRPASPRVVQGESDLLGTLTRTQVIGGEMPTI